MKTLHPSIHGAILAQQQNQKHMQQIGEHNIEPISIVIVNLYPFKNTVTRQPTPDKNTCIENIDIGGPALIRAAAKNHEDVYVVTDPEDYEALAHHLGAKNMDRREDDEFRRRLAWKAY